MGTPDNPHPTFVNAHIKGKELKDFMYFLHEFLECFAWTYAEMPGLDPEIAVHKLNISKDVKPVRQIQWRTKPKFMEKIEKEVQKLRDVQFIREEQHPDWIANIVPVTKKNGQIRVCIDFQDLNKASTKDYFLLPIPEIMIDNTFGYERMSFMDGFSRYNQIKMSSEDESTPHLGPHLGCIVIQSCLSASRMQEPHIKEP